MKKKCPVKKAAIPTTQKIFTSVKTHTYVISIKYISIPLILAHSTRVIQSEIT